MYLATLAGVAGYEVMPDLPAATIYRHALKKAHPDHGGSRELLEQVQDAGRALGVA
jgi:hypothetical protein